MAGQHTVVADSRSAPARSADGDVADLSIGRKVAEEHEVAQRVAHRLLMQRSPEDAGVEPRRGRRVRNNDVEMFEAQVIERQRLRRCALRDDPDGERSSHHGYKNGVHSRLLLLRGSSGLLLDATTLPNHTAGMNRTEKIAVSLPRGIADRARRAVRQGRAPSVSAYVASALEEKARLDELAALLDEMLAESGGPLTAAERRAADRALGLPKARRQKLASSVMIPALEDV